MKKNGFAPVVLVLLVIAGIAILGAGAYFYSRITGSTMPPIVASSTPPVVIATSTPPVITPTSTAPVGFIMMPDNGPVGTPVTIYGSGFAATNNTVTIDGMVGGSLKDLSSNGKSITFTIPSSVGPNCQPNQACPQYLLEVTPRVYAIAIISNGITQAIGNFTVTASGTPIGL